MNKLIILILLLASTQIRSQTVPVRISIPLDGSEGYSDNSAAELSLNKNTKFPHREVRGGSVTYNHTGIFTVYDFESNAVPQQIWNDPLVPSNVTSVFMYSLTPGVTNRYCAYLFSFDGGANWTHIQDVPQFVRSGFPAVSGLINGAAVIADHVSLGGSIQQTKLYYDAGPGFGLLTELDPGPIGSLDAIFPRLVVTGNSIAETKIIFISAESVPDGPAATNTCTNISPPGTFSGYNDYNGQGGENYSLAVSPNGIIGHAYLGNPGSDYHDVFYRFSNNNGLNWSSPLKIWDWNQQTDSIGCLDGVSMVFGNNNLPYVAFNTSLLLRTGFFPTLPSSIRVWTPTINGGIPVVIADSSNVPFYPNLGNVSDAYLPVCRPAIGRSNSGNVIAVGFSATSGIYGPEDSSSYFSAWMCITSNNGASWEQPEKITPDEPLKDWRFLSLSPVNNLTGNQLTLHLLCLADSVPGTSVTGGSSIGTGECINIKYSSTISLTPAAPVLLSPSNGSNGVSVFLTFNWLSISNALFYGLQVSIDSNFSNLVFNEPYLQTNHFSVYEPGALSYNTKYYWRVDAGNVYGRGPYSPTWNFRTETFTPLPPVLVNPPDNSLNNSLTPLLDWNIVGNAISYDVQLGADSSFSTILFTQYLLFQTQYEVPENILDTGATYFWRARGANSNGTGPWSPAFRFKTVGRPAPPVLISPPNGTTGLNLTPVLVWNSVTGASQYSLQVSEDSVFLNTVINVNNLTSTQYQVPEMTLQPNHKYFWRANAYHQLGTSPWSDVWNFRTQPTGIQVQQTDVPVEFRLYDNYPNPFNPYTNIMFDIPQSHFVSLSIFDLTGREIECVVNDYLYAGRYVIQFTSENMSSGIYILRFRSGNFTAVKKLVLIK